MLVLQTFNPPSLIPSSAISYLRVSYGLPGAFPNPSILSFSLSLFRQTADKPRPQALKTDSHIMHGLPVPSLPSDYGTRRASHWGGETFNGLAARVKRVRARPGGDPQKVREVRTRCRVSLPSESHKSDRSSIRWHSRQDAWYIRTSSPFWMWPLILFGSLRFGCRAGTFRDSSPSVPMPTDLLSCVSPYRAPGTL